jgi:hypothetical protein
LDNFDLGAKQETSSRIFPEIDFDAMLSKYGPEGCWEIAEKLREISMNDMYEALEQCKKHDDVDD